jgi:hypothetical protein
MSGTPFSAASGTGNSTASAGNGRIRGPAGASRGRLGGELPGPAPDEILGCHRPTLGRLSLCRTVVEQRLAAIPLRQDSGAEAMMVKPAAAAAHSAAPCAASCTGAW